MSGHSKWSNIRTKKEKIDNERAKIFTKLSKEISAAVRNFGSDLESNRKLRDLIAKAKANNVPNDNIERLIKKASGDVDKKCYEEIVIHKEEQQMLKSWGYRVTISNLTT